MTTVSRFCALLALLGSSFSLHAADYYVAETGRTAKTEINTSAAMALAGDPGDAMATNNHAHFEGDGHDHSHDHAHANAPAGASAPLVEMSVKDLYFPEVEKALLKSGVDRLGLQNQGVESTLRTFAEIQLHAITGKVKYEGMDPVYAVLGMIYQNVNWARVPMIPVENTELATAFKLDPKKHNRVSSVWVMKNPEVRMMVMSQLSGMESTAASAMSADAQKALKQFAYRIGTFLNLPGELKLVPMTGQPSIWLAPLHLQRPELLADTDADFAREVASIDKNSEPYKSLLTLDKALSDAFNNQEPEGVAAATSGYIAQAEAGGDYISPLKRKMDFIQTDFHPFKRSAQLFMLAFFAFLIYLIMLRKKRVDGSVDGDGTGLVDGRAEEYSRRTASDPSPVATALQSLQPGLAMAGSGPDAGVAPDFGGAGFETPAAFDNTGARNYGDPLTTAALEAPKGSRTAWSIAFFFMLMATLALVFALANRAYLGGRMPVSNMYESITFAMGAFALLAVVFEGVYRRGWVGIGACFAGWILMTMANSMPLHSRAIEPLVAVLNSVWLNFHVTSLLISYSCFLLAFVFSVLFLIKEMTGNRPGMLPRAETFEYLTYRSVQFGWPLLTLGIFLGAVWANTAWGSFWSWDPKETWALITWLTYTVYLHLRINLGWNGRKSIIASMIGFIMVLVTYFGVSYLPGLAGGMHSYAEPIKR